MSGKPYNRRSFLRRVAGSTILMGGMASAGCATATGVTDQDPTDPVGQGRGTVRNPNSVYSSRGWNGAGTANQSYTQWTDIDVNGEVGHPLDVYGPYGECGNGSPFTYSAYVSSGSLPPGLTMSSNGRISGIPQERGHWIVTLTQSGQYCGGVTFNDSSQQVRFHITGSGQVIQ